ncbi:MAG: pro-sigmaK processing inhibitor BofA family protein [Oscillospiraceae bacterium]|nr:pro-sigmaK processing inhibitor BofA family protein [Oscillospiraceae bacterium]
MPNFLTGQSIGTIVIVGIVLLLSVTIFRRPIRLLLRLVMNTIGGFIMLFVVNFLGQFIGISLTIGWFNAVIVGIFGLPGVGFLLILQWLLVV